VTGCAAGDANGDSTITVDEIITAVNNALEGCEVITPPTTCGNGVTEGTEQCDNGGICIGGDNAGTECDAEEDCVGNGVCTGGTSTGRACDDDSDCPGSECVHCRPFGGDGCAANCTNETTIPFNLEPGVQLGADDLEPGTSGVIVYSSFLNIPLPLMGSLMATIGQERDGVVPMVVRAEDIQFPAIPVLSLACACVGGAPARTCGGVVFEADGTTLAEDCTNDESACEGRAPCAPLHGPGNTISGVIGCNGLSPINLDAVLENGELSLDLSGEGPAGSAVVIASINIALVLGGCTGSGGAYGPDGMFCTEDDPAGDLTVVGTGPTTTGTACGTVKGDSPEFDVGPACREGSPATCTNNTADISGMCLVTALPFGDVEQLGDLVGTITLCAE
ncbi:MAG TPA: hypothetical protein VEB21_20875, partial [Terriglobales bacterium]|nr:hypothetical protein [Terriglobales bacterium]